MCQQHGFLGVQKYMWTISGCLQELEVIFLLATGAQNMTRAVLHARRPTSEFTGVPAAESTSENGSN